MDTLAELWQSQGYKDIGNWIDGAIAVALLWIILLQKVGRPQI